SLGTDRYSAAAQCLKIAAEFTAVKKPDWLVADGPQRFEIPRLLTGRGATLHECDGDSRTRIVEPCQVVETASGWQQTKMDALSRQSFLVAEPKFVVCASFGAGRHHNCTRRQRLENEDAGTKRDGKQRANGKVKSKSLQVICNH